MQYNNGYFAMGGNPVSMIDPSGMKSTTGHYDDVQEHGLSETPERGGGGSPVTIDGMPVYGSSAMLQHLVETEMQAGANFNSSDITFSNYTVTAGDGTKYRTYSRSTANKIQDVLYQHADKLSGFISTVTFPTVEEANNGSDEHNGNTYQYGEAPIVEASKFNLDFVANYNSGEIKQWNKSFADKWSEGENFFSNFSYKLVDGVSVSLQSFVYGPESKHLNGASVIGNDRMDALVNTTATTITLGEFSGVINANNWFRLGIGKHNGQKLFRAAWGAHPKHAEGINPSWLKDLNKYIRSVGGGHWDIWKF